MLTVKEMTVTAEKSSEQNKPTLENLPQMQPKIVIVMPAYNAALTLENLLCYSKGSYDQIILVDDASSDDTLEVARN
jgi:cellulose synthase/poly-beta-1,6-N-acetylglucosamine synthase-like glycosyltransferase